MFTVDHVGAGDPIKRPAAPPDVMPIRISLEACKVRFSIVADETHMDLES